MENSRRSFCFNTKGLEVAVAWLGPRELGSFALTCRAMAKCVAELTERRAADVAQGLERCSVPVCNQYDSCRYPWFVYTPFCLLSSSRSSSSLFHAWGNESSSSSSSKEFLFSDTRNTCLKELGILSSTGILGAVGCRCAGNCALLAHGTTDLPLPSVAAAAEDKSCDEVCVVTNDAYSSSWENGRRRRRRRGQSLECFCGKTSDGYCAYNADTSKLCLLTTTTATPRDKCRKIQLLDKMKNNRVDILSCDGISSSLDLNGEEEEEEGEGEEVLVEVEEEEEEGPLLVMECGGACSCSSELCGFRVTQQGLAVHVAVVRQQNTGWGLHAAQLISKGSFVCEYAGELLTTREAQQRQKVYDTVEEMGSERKRRRKCGSALLVLREFLPSKQACVRLNIDATRVGNVARFINHACDGGNLLPVLVRSAGSLFPKLALFARQDIHEGEELTYSYGGYGGAAAAVASKSQPCFCGTSCCRGTLPSDKT